MRLQELRGTYGIKAPAPICATDEFGRPVSSGRSSEADCQAVQAPLGHGARLVPDAIRSALEEGGQDGEIRLTYRQLQQLIEDAVRNLT